jgi:cellulose synthase/poly-beta-1,6-N-acetylglucosamine synthase-like glycosyltransferase
MTVFVPRIQPGGADARQGQACARTIAHFPAERAEPGRGAVFAPSPRDEAAILAHAGVRTGLVERLQRLAQRWNVPLRDAARSLAAVDSRYYRRAVASACGLDRDCIDARVALRPLHSAPEPYRLLTSSEPIPLDAPKGGFAVNAEDVPAEAIAALADAMGPARDRLVLMSRRELTAAIAETYGPQIAQQAAGGLRQRNPRLSAATGPVNWQIVFLALAGGLFLGAAIFALREALAVCSAGLSLMFLITITLRVAAALHACYRHTIGERRRYPRLSDAELPRYTVLVAMFREARVLPQLVEALGALDYPPAKLEVKLVLEAVDAETIAAARGLRLPPHFEVVVVPDGSPRTKPRALNYALQFAGGDYLVIYDAEDRPDPGQLRKAAAQFSQAAPEVACLQAKLIFDNAFENWLSKQFTIEYASLFGGILPMLDRARLPMPLGGTSNHFRIRTLRRIGAWDAHNVTEDADLGIRFYRAGLRAEVLDSTTYEEAACQPGNWLRQRTRWLKGWIQTYGVHMRQPVRLFRELGPFGFLAFQGHFAGIIIAALVHPWSYVLLLHDAAAGLLFLQPMTFFGHQIWLIALFNLAAGYLASLALGFFVLQRRHVRRLTPQLVFIPVYWLFVSAAAYRAVYQLIVAPHYWEKTEHGVTRMRRKPAV